MSEIKKCPFCNGRAIMRERFINGVANVKHYRLECVDCHASFLNWNKNTSKAAAAWNRRADHIRDTTKKVSNADRIRGMSDEELADSRVGELIGIAPCPLWIAIDVPERIVLSKQAAVEMELAWLQQPAETEGTE